MYICTLLFIVLLIKDSRYFRTVWITHCTGDDLYSPKAVQSASILVCLISESLKENQYSEAIFSTVHV